MIVLADVLFYKQMLLQHYNAYDNLQELFL